MIRFEQDPVSGDLVAVCTFRVGVSELEERVRVGPWEGPDPDPGGLLGTPVILLPSDGDVEIARAGALRSGDHPPVLLLPGDVPRPALQLLVAVAERVEVVLFTHGHGPLMNLVRALGGRPLPAIPLPDRDACSAFLEGCRVDLDIAIPSSDGIERERIRTVLEALALQELHHIVEVDPSPAFDASGQDLDARTGAGATAAAAGVLAGRLAAANRRRRQGL